MNDDLKKIINNIKAQISDNYEFTDLIKACDNYTPKLTNGESILIQNIFRMEQLMLASNKINGNFVISEDVLLVTMMNSNSIIEFLDATKKYEVNEFIIDVMFCKDLQEVLENGYVVIAYENYMTHYFKEDPFKKFFGYRCLIKPETHL